MRPLGSPMYRWEDNTNMGLQDVGVRTAEAAVKMVWVTGRSVYCLLVVNIAYPLSCADSNNGGGGSNIIVKNKMKELK